MSSKALKNTNASDLRKSIYRKNSVVVCLSCLFILLILLGACVQWLFRSTHDKLDVQSLSAVIDYRDEVEPIDDDDYGKDLAVEIKKIGIAEYDKEYSTDKVRAKKDAYDNWKANKQKLKRINGVKTFLFVCIDDESYADLLLLFTVNENNRELSVTNLSEKSYVYIPRVGTKRLADTYYFGDMELTVKTIEENYGINIDSYFLTDYEEYIKLMGFIGADDVHYSKSVSPQDMTKLFIQTVKEKSIIKVVQNVYPCLTTGISYEDYLDLMVNVPEYFKYDILYYNLPVENKIASFKESYKLVNRTAKKTVLLNTYKGTESVIDRILTTNLQSGGKERAFDTINPIKMALLVYGGLCILIVLLIFYLLFIHKRKIVYVDVNTGKKYKSKKSYRRGAKAHPYPHADVLPGEVDGLFADSALTAQYEHEVRMPSTCLYVYCAVNSD